MFNRITSITIKEFIHLRRDWWLPLFMVVGGTLELLIIGWGSTRGVIEEAVDRARADGYAVSSLHLTYLQPMASGIGEILKRFAQVMTVEMSWSDSVDDAYISAESRRYSNLAWLLRARYLVDVDCWSEVKGQPLKPGTQCCARNAQPCRQIRQRRARVLAQGRDQCFVRFVHLIHPIRSKYLRFGHFITL